MNIPFTKMHGLGNDFVVIDGVTQAVTLDAPTLRHIADRHRGVGCDQILLLEPSDSADFRYRIFNPDGNEVEQCGNGARCVARFVRAQGLSGAEALTFDTLGGAVHTRLLEHGAVAVAMGVPRFAPAAVPFDVAEEPADTAAGYPLAVGDTSWRVGVVSLGNPHAVLRIADTTTAPVAALGPVIERHARFPHGANVGFMQVRTPEQVRLRVWERGAGETAACGSGGCAAVAVGQAWGLLGERVTVALPGGELVIAWSGGDNPMWMTGPAETAFDGTLA